MSSRYGKTNFTSRNIIIKLSEVKYKEKILKVTREKLLITYEDQ